MNSPNEKAMQAILYGHSCAMRLKLRLDDPMADSGSVSSYDLAKSMVDCFSNAISVLSDDKPKSEDYQFSDFTSRGSPLSPHHQKSQSKKRKIDSTYSSENWRDDSPDPLYYDGYLWRKYGQKSIKNSHHQRSYYRCSYNIEHDCKATKHEQQVKDNPPVYRTTYFGQHTCKINNNQDDIFSSVLDPVDDLKNANMIRFGEHLDPEGEISSHSSGFTLSVKHEETIDQYREITSDDQDYCQHVIEENQLLPSGSYTPLSSSGSESVVLDSDVLLDNFDSWDRYDQFDFGLP